MPIDEDTKEALAAEAAARAATDTAAAAAQAAAGDNGAEDKTGNQPDPKPKDTPTDPVADPKPKDTPEPTLDTEKWGSTGDETGDSVLLLLQTSGVDPDVAKALLYDAVKDGDPTKIDRDALIEKVGKVNANLILAGIENFTNKQHARVAAIVTEVHSAVGGEANWTKVKAWIGTNVPEAKRTELAAMIDEGGAKAKFAATELLSLYNADEKNTSLGSTTRIEGDAKAPNSGRAIDRRTYAQELEKAHRNGAKPAVIAEIQAARERGRKRGL